MEDAENAVPEMVHLDNLSPKSRKREEAKRKKLLRMQKDLAVRSSF